MGFVIFLLLACGNKKPQVKVNVNQKPVEVDAFDYSLNISAREDWDMIEDLFRGNLYFPFLYNHHLEQDCIKCDDISLSYECRIDDEGKVIAITLHGSDIDCRGISDKTKREMEDTFLQYFKNITYPASLRGKFIFFTVGQVTKC